MTHNNQPSASSFTNAYFTPRSNVLTAKDRENIDKLIQAYDRPSSYVPKKPPKPVTINFSRDVQFLITHGFSFGFTHSSMFGVDNQGFTWQVWGEGAKGTTRWRRSISPEESAKFEPSVGGTRSFEGTYDWFYSTFGAPSATPTKRRN